MTGTLPAEYRERARLHLGQAQRMLADINERPGLTYAALELRQCIEGLAYSLFATYLDELPPGGAATWQPAQVFRELLKIDETVHFSRTLSIAKQPGPRTAGTEYVTLGEDRRLSPKWANKAYNRLGSYLHVPTLAAPPPASDDRMKAHLVAIATRLAEIFAATIWNFKPPRPTIKVTCDCGTPIIRSEEALKAEPEVACGTCGRFYTFQPEDTTFIATLREWPCRGCEHPNVIDAHLVREGALVVCERCAERHLIKRTWSVAPAPEPA